MAGDLPRDLSCTSMRTLSISAGAGSDATACASADPLGSSTAPRWAEQSVYSCSSSGSAALLAAPQLADPTCCQMRASAMSGAAASWKDRSSITCSFSPGLPGCGKPDHHLCGLSTMGLPPAGTDRPPGVLAGLHRSPLISPDLTGPSQRQAASQIPCCYSAYLLL